MRAEQGREKTPGAVQATLEWAAQTSNARRAVSGATWDEAVAQMEAAAAKAERPLAFPDQPGVTRKYDRAVMDAIRELGGTPGDLQHIGSYIFGFTANRSTITSQSDARPTA